MFQCGVNGRKVPADFPAQLDEFGDAAAGGPFQPSLQGVFAFLALELERQPQALLQQPRTPCATGRLSTQCRPGGRNRSSRHHDRDD